MYRTIDEVRTILNDAVSRASPGVDTYVDTRLSEVLDRQQIAYLLSALLSDRNRLPIIASQSYAHSNGFDKIALISSINPEYKLRLHIWWPGSEHQDNIPVELIHDHRWHFLSTVLLGSLRMEVFQHAEQAPLKFQYRYSPRDPHKQSYSMELVGRVPLTSGFKTRLVRGSTYSLDPGTYHRVIYDGDEVSATAFLRWGATKDVADVFSDIQIGGSDTIPAPSFSISEIEAKFSHLLQLL